MLCKAKYQFVSEFQHQRLPFNPPPPKSNFDENYVSKGSADFCFTYQKLNTSMSFL